MYTCKNKTIAFFSLMAQKAFFFQKYFYVFKNIHIILTMCQASFSMLYSTNFTSESPRTQVLTMILVLKVRNLRHERVGNLCKVMPFASGGAEPSILALELCF